MNTSYQREGSIASLRRMYYWSKSHSMGDTGKHANTDIHELTWVCFKKMHQVQERSSVTMIKMNSHVHTAIIRDVHVLVRNLLK